MQKLEISYSPYKMKTNMVIDGQNVLNLGGNYKILKEFIKNNTPLQTWVEPVPYKNWKGLVNELVDEDISDGLNIIFDGRKIDFEDLKWACELQNTSRKNKVEIKFEHRKEYSDSQLSANIDIVMKELLSDRFKKLVNMRKGETLQKTYDNLRENYEHAKNEEFHIAFAGVYSSGKSTIVNALIRKDVLPTSDKTCTSKIFKLKHDRSLGESLSLRCLDKNGKVVVSEEKFNTDLACKKRLLEITPIGANESNPPEIDTIEIRMNLSHLYPSPALEEKLKLVIVDTPGCNSAKTRSGDAGKNRHEEISLGMITAKNKEMVVICADGQNYEDESIGEFLREIAETSKEDSGYFNDRFLFVLNKCDLKKYNNDEKAEDAKKAYAEYLMDLERWGYGNDDETIDFTPKIFMTSAYAALAIVKGADKYTESEKKSLDVETRNLVDGYAAMKRLTVEYSDENYFFSQLCDIPKYRQEEFKRKIETAIGNNEDVQAVEFQCGILCLESTIRDYIERYAYPIKVQSLLDTFEDLLKDVEEFTKTEADKLKKKRDDLTSKNTQKIEVGKDKRADEQHMDKLSDIRKKVAQEQKNVDNLVIDERRLLNIQKRFDATCGEDEFVKRLWRGTATEYTAKEKEELLTGIQNCYNQAWGDVKISLENFREDYDKKLQEPLDILKKCLEELEREKKFEFDGYNFKNSVSYQNAMKLNIDAIRKEAERTKTKAHTRVIANPIKQQKYKWYQFFEKIEQFFAPDTISEQVEDKYNLDFLKKTLEKTNAGVVTLCYETREKYEKDYENIKEGIKKELDQLAKDLMQTEEAIQEQNQRIAELSEDINRLEKAKRQSEDTVLWLQTLKRKIEEV